MNTSINLSRVRRMSRKLPRQETGGKNKEEEEEEKKERAAHEMEEDGKKIKIKITQQRR